MDHRVPRAILDHVLANNVEFSTHSLERMALHCLSRADALNAVTTGRVVKRERDERGESGHKYTIAGPALDGRTLYTEGKLMEGADGTFYFYITVKKYGRR